MKIDDLVESPLSKYGIGNPMGISQKVGAGLRSLVPGSTGARAQGELQTGKVANIWKQEYMKYVGRTGVNKHGSTESFISFLKKKKFTDAQIKQVLKGTISEAALMYERALGVGEIDNLMLRAAKVAAASEFDPTGEIPDDPNPTAPREPGSIDKAVNVGKKVAPHITKAAGTLGQKVSNIGKKLLIKKQPKQRIEPTMGTPTPRNMPPLVKQSPPVVPQQKFQPARKAPKMKMKTKPVIKFKED